jgi:energy-coupling factor transporter ATP-binding protein EcfA2
MPMMTNGPSFAPVQSMSRVGMWGAPGSGKTTFLAALGIAAARDTSGRVLLFGADDPSTDFLTDETARITQRREFPPATVTSQHLSWIMRMGVEVPVKKRLMSTTVIRPFEFNLDLLDAPGGWYGDQMEAARTTGGHYAATSGGNPALGFDDEGPAAATVTRVDEADFIAQIGSCDGLLLFFDPLREAKEGDAFLFFYRTLMKLAQRSLTGQSRVDAALPQYVAVCTTMFDRWEVYERARDLGYCTTSLVDEYQFPRVKDDLAERFFVEIVRNTVRGNADLMRNQLHRFFAPGRVKFFVTSAIGFYLDRQFGMFQDRQNSNVNDQDGRIKGQIYPINVIEPITWLARSLAREEANRGR